MDMVKRIVSYIERVDHLASSIAAAVEEQSATTNEMSSGVNGAAESTHGALGQIDQVKDAATVTNATHLRLTALH